jgi:hypothetical protein
MAKNGIPANLISLHQAEEQLRDKATDLISDDARFSLHLAAIEQAMKLADLLLGPFMEKSTLEAVISEMGQLALMVGEQLDRFFPKHWDKANLPRAGFMQVQRQWLETFYSSTAPSG